MAHVEFIYKDKKGRDTWRLYVEGPKHQDGSRNQIRRTFKTTDKNQDKAKKQAERAAMRLEDEVNKPQYVEPTKETFSQHVERWLEVHGETVQPKTLYRYKELLDRILPYLGSIPVERIRMEHIE